MGLAHIGIFVGKLLVFMVIFIWVRWMLPRFRYDQLMDLGWKKFIPLALLNILVTAVVLWIKEFEQMKLIAHITWQRRRTSE